MIVTISPHSFNQQETLSTLRFGSRAKNIKNVTIINKEPTIAVLKVYLDKAEKTIRMLLAKIDFLEHKRRLGCQPPSDKKLESMLQKRIFLKSKMTVKL